MRIAVVGAGNGGTKLIKLFQEIPGADVKIVIDRDKRSPGMVLARELGISQASDISEIGPSIEMVIEATGVPAVANMVQEHFGGVKKIIDSDTAALMMGIVDRQTEIADKLNDQLGLINETSDKLQSEMAMVTETVESLEEISKRLVHSADESRKYIEQTDSIITAVNKITQQIKILGLNANIEAARAGEHGKGFSVVATEVQKLSDSTASFAAEISSLLKSLSQENNQVAEEIQHLNRLSKDQTNVSTNVNDVLDLLMKNIH